MLHDEKTLSLLGLLDVFDAAERLGYTPQRLGRLARAGKVPCVILPENELRFIPSELSEWVAAHRQEVADA